MSRFLNSSSMSATEAARGLTLILIGCCLVQLPAVAADIAFVGAQVVDRSGPHSLDNNWTPLSAFLHHEPCALERSDETTTTQSFT